MKERDIIARMRKEFPHGGIGDDAAVLPPLDGDLLFSCDAVTEDVHFERRYSSPGQVIQKLITANVSDIFAMGGKPHALLISAALPNNFLEMDLDSLVEGLKVSCSAYDVALVGGDTVSSSDGAFFDAAILGVVPRGAARMRSGARVGDAAVLFGEIGLSRAGLSLLRAFLGKGGPCVEGLPTPRIKDCAGVGTRLRNILPRMSLVTGPPELQAMAAGIAHVPFAAEVLRFIKHHIVPRCYPIPDSWNDGYSCINAMIDISDGLGKDLRTLCAESCIGVHVESEKLPIPGSIALLFDLAADELVDFALSSGEEYVLLAAVRPEAVPTLSSSAAVIGRFVPQQEGMIISSSSGSRELPDLGWEHGS